MDGVDSKKSREPKRIKKRIKREPARPLLMWGGLGLVGVVGG